MRVRTALERLARRIRTQTPTATVEEFDAAYSAIVRLAAALRPLMGRGPMRKEWAECSSLPAIPRYHDPPTSFPQPAWKSRAGMWEESAWRTIASVDFV